MTYICVTQLKHMKIAKNINDVQVGQIWQFTNKVGYVFTIEIIKLSEHFVFGTNDSREGWNNFNKYMANMNPKLLS